MTDVPQNISRIIRQKGLVQRAVVERAGFTANQFCDMLNGRKTLKADYIPQIASALDVPIAELFEGKESSQRQGAGC